MQIYQISESAYSVTSVVPYRNKMAAEQKRCGCKLFVRHLPSVLSNVDKTDLLKHFGATDVICMGRSSKMVRLNVDLCSERLLGNTSRIFTSIQDT